jgi:O-succinylbenzoate synthase
VAGENPNYSPETVDTAWVIIRDHLARRVLGQPFDAAGEVAAVLGRDIRGHRMARAAVEMGMWELEAQLRDLPLAGLLGGSRGRIETGISVGIQSSPEVLVEKALAALEQGYRKIKIKVMPGADLEFAGAARQELGPQAPLMVDANNAYSMADIEILQGMDELGLLMIEQPLAWDDLVQHARLQRELKTPICLDESITGLDRVQDMLELGSGRIVNIKPGRVGGFSESIAIHDHCRDQGIPVWCGGMLESGVGRGYNVALASLPNFTLPGDISPSARYWEGDIVLPEWEMDKNGSIAVPLDSPGIGVEVDRDRVEDLTVRTETAVA